MRRARVAVDGIPAGVLIEHQPGRRYSFEYDAAYQGPPVSLTMPVAERRFSYDRFPPCFEGLLPEGAQLDSLLKLRKLERSDLLGQLLTVGADLVGAVTVEPAS